MIKMTKLSTYGMLLLGTMVLVRYMVDEPSVAELTEKSEIINLEYQSPDLADFKDDRSPGIVPETHHLFAAADNSVTIPSEMTVSVDNSNEYAEHVVSIEDVPVHITQSDAEPELASVDEGQSSVVYKLIIEPQETIKNRESSGVFPLDQGNTISNAMDQIFPRRPSGLDN